MVVFVHKIDSGNHFVYEDWKANLSPAWKTILVAEYEYFEFSAWQMRSYYVFVLSFRDKLNSWLSAVSSDTCIDDLLFRQIQSSFVWLITNPPRLCENLERANWPRFIQLGVSCGLRVRVRYRVATDLVV